MYFDAPPESPTTRGLAAIVYDSLNGDTPETILSVPNGFHDMHLAEIDGV